MDPELGWYGALKLAYELRWIEACALLLDAHAYPCWACDALLARSIYNGWEEGVHLLLSHGTLSLDTPGHVALPLAASRNQKTMVRQLLLQTRFPIPDETVRYAITVARQGPLDDVIEAIEELRGPDRSSARTALRTLR